MPLLEIVLFLQFSMKHFDIRFLGYQEFFGSIEVF